MASAFALKEAILFFCRPASLSRMAPVTKGAMMAVSELTITVRTSAPGMFARRHAAMRSGLTLSAGVSLSWYTSPAAIGKTSEKRWSASMASIGARMRAAKVDLPLPGKPTRPHRRRGYWVGASLENDISLALTPEK